MRLIKELQLFMIFIGIIGKIFNNFVEDFSVIHFLHFMINLLSVLPFSYGPFSQDYLKQTEERVKRKGTLKLKNNYKFNSFAHEILD